MSGTLTMGKRAALLVNEIDAALQQIADALHRAQPPYSGKIAIKFVDEGAELLTPIVVKLQQTRAGKIILMRVPSTNLPQRAAWKSSFSINHGYVKELLSEAEYLIKSRKEINQRIRIFRLWESSYCNSHEEKVSKAKAHCSDVHAQIEDNLRTRTTRSSKEKERDELGIVTIVMENKQSKAKRGKRTSTPRPTRTDPLSGDSE